MERVQIHMPEHMIEWLDSQGGEKWSRSLLIRQCVEWMQKQLKAGEPEAVAWWPAKGEDDG